MRQAKKFPKLKLKRVTRIITPAHANWLRMCGFLSGRSFCCAFYAYSFVTADPRIGLFDAAYYHQCTIVV